MPVGCMEAGSCVTQEYRCPPPPRGWAAWAKGQLFTPLSLETGIRHQPQPRCTQRPWEHGAASHRPGDARRQTDRRKGRQAGRQPPPPPPRGARGRERRGPASGEPAGRPLEGRGRGPGRERGGTGRRRERPNRHGGGAGRTQGLAEGRRDAQAGTPRWESGSGSSASPAEAAHPGPQHGRGGGAGGGRRRRGPPLAPPPGQRPWPRARCWFRVVRQQQHG